MIGEDSTSSSEPDEISVSFNRVPREHVDVMLSVGRRFTREKSQENPYRQWLAFIFLVVIIGSGAELLRQYFSAPLSNSQLYPTRSTVMALLALLPASVLIGYALLAILGRKNARRMLEKRLSVHSIVNVDFTASGIRLSGIDSEFFFSWRAIRKVAIAADRIECDTDGMAVYVPARAFPDNAAFRDAFKRIHLLWRHGIEAAMAAEETLKPQ